MNLLRHWHRLPSEAVRAPLLEAFKVRLGPWLAWEDVSTHGRVMEPDGP